MKYIDCEKYAKRILDEAKKDKYDKYFMIMTVGDNPASQSYVRGKIKDCEYCGIPVLHAVMSKTVPEDTIASSLAFHNNRSDISSIILQLPLPDGMNEEKIIQKINPKKDVDGFTAASPFEPCTPAGIVYLLKEEFGDLTGKTALIIGRGKLVGRPLFDMLIKENCTVTMAHSKTEDLDSLLQEPFDFIISAAGKPKLVNLKSCNSQIVIDVGVNRDENGKLCGDCYNFDPDFNENLLVTPVPKGIGLLTRAMLIKNIQKANQGANNDKQ